MPKQKLSPEYVKTFFSKHECVLLSEYIRKKFSFEYVKNFFASQNCTLLEIKYDGSLSLLKYKCSCGHIGNIRFNLFKQGVRCRICYLKRKKTSNRNLNRKTHKICSNLLRRAWNGDSKVEKILGYSVNELQKSITNNVRWKEVKCNDWHIDHIFPIKAFLDFGITTLTIINCLDNLQPLSVKDNLKKSGSYNQEHFTSWLYEKHQITVGTSS